MKVDLYIACRYLFAKKSHNVINVISAISAAGIAIGTAALILILSVYNGFDRIIEDNMSDLDPDLLVTPSHGKYFTAGDDFFSSIEEADGVTSVSGVLQDNVFISYAGKQGVATVKGVDFTYGEDSPVSSHVVEGSFSRYEGDVPMAAVGAGLAYDMGIHTRFLDKLTLYYPDSSGKTSLLGPAASARSVSLRPGSLFSISATVDSRLVLVPAEAMQELLGKDESTWSGIEVRTDGRNTKALAGEIRDILGDGYTVKTRHELNESLYKMMRYEKFAIFMILIFVVIIVAFNIFGSLSMLMIEKARDIESLKAMGAGDSMTRRIFLYEGWLISLLGMCAGLAAGVALALVQQHMGIIKMPGDFFIESYPVVLQATDVLWTVAGVSLTGFGIAYMASRNTK